MLGCTTSSSKKPNEIDIFVGTKGLTAEFAKTAPPPRVFENSDFPILLRIRNKGAYSIVQGKQNGVISIARERDYIPTLTLVEGSKVSQQGESDNVLNFFVDGKTQINPQGDEIIASLNAKTGKLEPQSEQKSSTLTATLCYPYQTVLSTTVCIDSDVAGIRPGKKVCDVKDLAFSNGQGAPVSVTKIESQMIPVENDMMKPQFLIFIENKGIGDAVNINSYNKVCGIDSLNKDEVKNIWNVAFLRAYTSGDKNNPNNQMECTPNMENSNDKSVGFIRLRDKKDFVRCTFKNGIPRNSDAYTSPLRIEIDYGYVQTIAANFIIQKPLKY